MSGFTLAATRVRMHARTNNERVTALSLVGSTLKVVLLFVATGERSVARLLGQLNQSSRLDEGAQRVGRVRTVAKL
jgi:hypothetical protein